MAFILAFFLLGVFLMVLAFSFGVFFFGVFFLIFGVFFGKRLKYDHCLRGPLITLYQPAPKARVLFYVIQLN